MKRKTTNQFIEEAKKLHGDKYDYSMVDYKNNRTEIKIICPIHGEFPQKPDSHLVGRGCDKCGGTFKLTTEEFIKISQKVHNDMYDYSLVDYVNNSTNVKIICKKHGEFEQSPSNHINHNSGCDKCANMIKGKSVKLNNNIFIEKAKKIHNNKYDYSLVNYIGTYDNIKIICEKHGEFPQIPNSHLNGRGCPMCLESRGEKYIRQFLDKNNIKYDLQKRFKDCRYKLPLPFDFYISESNTCIEFDGIQHFESIKCFGGEEGLTNQLFKDNIKNNYCKINNIKLIRIKYDDDIEDILTSLFCQHR